jgi:hypothetical protein
VPSYLPPKKNSEYIFYVSLIAAAGATIQANPTLAAGDVKVSIDGGTFNNLATLPVVTPAGGKGVKVTLSAAEMNGDNISVLFSDAAGAEWQDLLVPIQPAAQTFDELDAIVDAIKAKTDSLTFTVANQIDSNIISWKGSAAPAMTGDAYAAIITVDTVVDAIKAKTDNLTFSIAGKVDAAIVNAASFAQAAADLVWSSAARTLTAFGFSVTVGTVNDKTGYSLSSAGLAAIWDRLTSALTTVGSIGKLIVDNLNAAVGTINTNVATLITAIGGWRIKKNTALNNFEFFMVLASDGVTGATGKTVTAQRSIDGGAVAACANAASEVGSGIYKINLATSDLNGDVITFIFTAALCNATVITIITQP